MILRKMTKIPRNKLKIILVFVIFAVIYKVINEQNYLKKGKYNLYSELDCYEFTSKEQKDALEHLMHEASILAKNETFEDKFPARDNFDDLAKDIVEFAYLSQKHFTIRTGTQERWEVQPHAWMINNKEQNLKILATLDMVQEVMPKMPSSDAICILGATLKRMEERLNYASSVVIKGFDTKNIILLAGERYATINVDGTQDELAEVAKTYNLIDHTKVIETHLAREAYKKSAFYNDLPVEFNIHVIDTPRGDLPRPTTQTTILELLDFLKEHDDIKSITFVSNQPYVKYQQAVIKNIISSASSDIKFEVVGSAASTSNLQPIIESLGSYIWAKLLRYYLNMEQKLIIQKL